MRVATFTCSGRVCNPIANCKPAKSHSRTALLVALAFLFLSVASIALARPESGYDLSSSGPDGKDGTSDDINNWSAG